MEKLPDFVFPLTFLTPWHITTPSQIPLAHEDLGANQLISRVALVGDDRTVNQIRVGSALPAVDDLRQLGARVVSWHLCRCWAQSSRCCIVLLGRKRDRTESAKLRITDLHSEERHRGQRNALKLFF